MKSGAPTPTSVMILLLSLLSHSALAMRLVVTGAAGYLGAEIACLAAEQGHQVTAVIKTGQLSAHLRSCKVLAVDDLADPATARDVVAEDTEAVIHAASVFRRVSDMESELVAPNIALAEQMVCACAASGARLVLTSSMAAVRGTGQQPIRPPAYTTEDWNTVSMRDGPGFEPYQYSKAQSERRAWQLAREVGLEMVSLCPSMIFGPPRVASCAGFSVGMVRSWLSGDSPAQSRLVVDVRDAAQAHINAATTPEAAGKRYITSCEARVPAGALADALRERLRGCGRADVAERISADLAFDGGAIPIGEQEVVASAGMAELGVQCRPTEVTLADMAVALLSEPQ